MSVIWATNCSGEGIIAGSESCLAVRETVAVLALKSEEHFKERKKLYVLSK